MTEPPSDVGALFVAVDVHYLHDSAPAAAVVAGERSFSRVTRTRTAMRLYGRNRIRFRRVLPA